MIFAFTASYLYWLLLPIALILLMQVGQPANEETGYLKGITSLISLLFGGLVFVCAWFVILAINLMVK